MSRIKIGNSARESALKGQLQKFIQDGVDAYRKKYGITSAIRSNRRRKSTEKALDEIYD